MESRALTPCYWMVSRASPLWSLGLATHGLTNRRWNHKKGSGFLLLTELMPATRLLGAKRSAHQEYTPAQKVKTVAYTCGGKCLYFYHWSNPVLNPRRRSTQGPPGLCTRTILTRRLALTVGGASQTLMFQISLLLVGNCVVNLDMPPLCRWPEGKAASQWSPGTVDVLAFIVSEVFEHLRVYLCPSTVAGIHTKLVLVGNSSRELALTFQKLHRVPCVSVVSSFLALSQRFQQSP